MSEFGGLWKQQNNLTCIKSVRVFKALKLDATRKRRTCPKQETAESLNDIRERGSISGRLRGQELRESRGGWAPGFPVPKNSYGFCGRKATLNNLSSELRSCVKVDLDVLGSPSLKVHMVSVDVRQH